GDDIRVIYAGYDASGMPNVRVVAPFSASINGNGGADNILVDFAVHHEAGAKFIFDSAVALDVFGGLGSGTIRVDMGPDPSSPPDHVGPDPQVNDSMHLGIHGEEGNDTIGVSLWLDGGANSAVDVFITGDGGSNTLALSLVPAVQRGGTLVANVEGGST